MVLEFVSLKQFTQAYTGNYWQMHLEKMLSVLIKWHIFFVE